MPQANETEQSVTLTVNETWYCTEGIVEVHSATMDARGGLPLQPGKNSMSFGAGVTVFYRAGRGVENKENHFIRIATSVAA